MSAISIGRVLDEINTLVIGDHSNTFSIQFVKENGEKRIIAKGQVSVKIPNIHTDKKYKSNFKYNLFELGQILVFDTENKNPTEAYRTIYIDTITHYNGHEVLHTNGKN